MITSLHTVSIMVSITSRISANTVIAVCVLAVLARAYPAITAGQSSSRNLSIRSFGSENKYLRCSDGRGER